MSIFAQSALIFAAFVCLDLIVFLLGRRVHSSTGLLASKKQLSKNGFWVITWGTFGIILTAYSLFLTLFNLLGGTIERHGHWAWLALLISSSLGGFITTFRSKKLEPLALLVAVFFLAQVAVAVFYPQFSTAGIASPELRFMVAAQLANLLIVEVTACLTYLFHGRKNRALAKVERIVAWRFVRAKKTAALSTVTFISIAGVTLGVALMIVSIGVLSGFERDMIDKMIGVNAHLTISAYSGYQITDVEDKVATINTHSEILASYPYLKGEVMVASATNLAGAALYGVNGPEAAKVINIFDKIELGNANFLDPALAQDTKKAISPLPGVTIADSAPGKIMVGAELMRILNIEIGDTIRVVNPIIEELSPAGPIPKSRSFIVGAVFNTKMYEYDSKYLYIPLAAARDFFESPDSVSGIGIKLKDAQNTATVAPLILKSIGGYPLRIHDWKAKNEALLASVELEKVVTFVVLIFIVLVASFSIINTLTMSVIEKGPAIALFKAIGANDLLIMKIFVYQGVFIGGFGSLLGSGIGCLLCQLVKYFGVWLDPEVYYIDQLPVYLEASDVLIITICAIAITFLASVFPARMAEHYNPVEGLRNG